MDFTSAKIFNFSARSVFDDSEQKNKFNNTIQQNQQSQSQSAADIPFEEEKYEGIKTVFDV